MSEVEQPQVGVPEKPEEEFVDVPLDNASYKIPKAFLEKLQARDRQMMDHIKAQAERLAELERENSTPVGNQPKRPATVEPEEDDLAEEFEKDPKVAIKKLKDRIKEELRAETSTENELRRAQDAFWSDFYSQHDDLRGFDHVVTAVLTKHRDTFSRLRPAEAQKRLGELVREEVSSLAGRLGKRRVPKEEEEDDSMGSMLESMGISVPRSGKRKPEKEQVTSLSDVISSRRAKRGM